VHRCWTFVRSVSLTQLYHVVFDRVLIIIIVVHILHVYVILTARCLMLEVFFNLLLLACTQILPAYNGYFIFDASADALDPMCSISHY
jgi:hypothetical protein